jgi:serine/threonine protein kinase
MSLAPGTRLGTYEILSPIGAGGMGEVYRARDTRLGRDVAIKVLPRELAATPEIRARFEREARLISSFNHPNICTVHDVGHEGDDFYLVMELVEGESLADRAARGNAHDVDGAGG